MLTVQHLSERSHPSYEMPLRSIEAWNGLERLDLEHVRGELVREPHMLQFHVGGGSAVHGAERRLHKATRLEPSVYDGVFQLEADYLEQAVPTLCTGHACGVTVSLVRMRRNKLEMTSPYSRSFSTVSSSPAMMFGLSFTSITTGPVGVSLMSTP